MNTDNSTRQVQRLASVLALVSGYYGIRASLMLPGFHHLLRDAYGAERPFNVGKLILEHPNGFLALVVITSIATLFVIWKKFENHGAVYPFLIGFQFLLTERAVSSVMDPAVQIIATMGNQ